MAATSSRGRKTSPARAGLDIKGLAALVKKNPGKSESFYSKESGIPMNLIGRALWEAEVVADPSLAIKPTAAAVARARDKDNLRWGRIAARAGITEAQVKALYMEAGGDPAHSYTGRGRNFNATGNGGEKTAKAAKTTAKASGTSGRRATRSTAKTTTAPRGRARTRAERAAQTKDPS